VKILSSRNEDTLELTYSNKKIIEENGKTKKKANKLNSEKREPFPSTGQRTTLTSGVMNQTKEGSNSASEIVGYMPLRGDFDVEYDNDAELLLAEMEFTGI
jgi:transcriptional adapter 2-alpha